MTATFPYSILEFTDPFGKIIFQLYAFLDRKRFRKNFKTRAEAKPSALYRK